MLNNISPEKGRNRGKMRMKWEQLLCPDRMRGKARRYPGDLRTEFEKDYHRIINSASFRRLQDKTQVFPLDKSDFIRTRLTHSLEVSSFGKSLGQNVSEKILREIKDESFKPEYKADVCDILQCAGLLHDIGNPPFGHFGEYCIRQWFRDNMDKMEFEGKPLSE
jgi:dGTPase